MAISNNSASEAKGQVRPEELFEGRKQALQNAIDLVIDAEVLQSAGRYARAFFLAQIATEELGKYCLLVSQAVNAVHGSLSWKEFRKGFRNHNQKTRKLLLFENLYNVVNRKGHHLLLTQKDGEMADLQDQAKMLSLYSDLTDTGFTLPSAQIDYSVAKLAVDLVKFRLEMVVNFERDVASAVPFEEFTREKITAFRERIRLDQTSLP